MKDIPKAFNKIQDKPVLRTIKSDIKKGDGHIQGIVNYGVYFLISHNDPGGSTGIIYVMGSNDMYYKFNTFFEGYNHPGGMARIGDVLVVPLEGKSDSLIAFYDLSRMTSSNPPTLINYQLRRGNKCGCVGITNFSANSREWYLLAAYDNGKMNFYLDHLNKNPEPNFGCIFDCDCSQKGYQAIQLLTDISDNVYMIGFHTKGIDDENELEGYDDYMDLYKIDPNRRSVSEIIQSRLMHCRGNNKGLGGIHFRWAAHCFPTSECWFNILATQRNEVHKKIEIDEFYT